MARRHQMTPARRAALRKAQRASAAKRRGKGKKSYLKSPHPNGGGLSRRRVYANRAVAGVAITSYVAYSGHKAYKSYGQKSPHGVTRKGRKRNRTMDHRLRKMGYYEMHGRMYRRNEPHTMRNGRVTYKANAHRVYQPGSPQLALTSRRR